MTDRMVRVIVADGSITVRHVLRRLLEEEGTIEVVAEAGDGPTAAKVCRRVDHDVVVIDVALPGLDDSTARAMAAGACASPVVVVTAAREGCGAGNTAFRAIAARVAGVYPKPEDPDAWRALGRELATTVTAIARPRRTGNQLVTVRTRDVPEGAIRVVGIGASTGGPRAVRDLLAAATGALRSRVVIVQHIAAGFEAGLADWLVSETGLDVRVAGDDEMLEPGSVRIAPANHHVVVTQSFELRLDGQGPPTRGHRPSASVLFRSLADLPPAWVAAVLLSGMGDDGVDGMLELRRAGAFTVVQDRTTCAVPGMPRAALERGASDLELSPAEIGRVLRGGGPTGGCP